MMVTQKSIRQISIWTLLILNSCIANSANAENTFYNDRERGWYYHENFDENKELETKESIKSPKISLREMDDDQVLSTLSSVQKEMQVRQARYTLEPTLENARDFLDYQRLMFKNGEQASEAMQTALLKYPYLDSRLENPINQQAIKIKTLESDEANNLKIKEFAQHFKLIYLFKEGCSYCQEFQPVLEKIVSDYKFEIEAISSDGRKLEGSFITTRIDNGLASKLNITTYPTLIAYNSQNNIYLPVSRGFLPFQDLKLNILHVYSHVVKLAMEEAE
jgi:conjugal transfer pilus assembly protein TraF